MNLNMNSAESLVAQIQGLSGNIAELTQLRNYLKQSDDSLHAESTRLAPLLGELDPSIHSLGYLYILEACTSAPISKEQANEVVLSVARFINVCAAEQIRLAPDKFISVCKRFKDQVMLLEDPLRGVAAMLTALRKLQLSSEQLTTLHPDFLLLCLLSKCYKAGLSILEDDIFDVDQPRDLFLYCYYGGMICIGQKKLRKALELLHNFIALIFLVAMFLGCNCPMPIISAIAVEAYKNTYWFLSFILGRYILFSTSLPKYTSSAAQRNLKNFSQPYLELVNSYSTGKISELETCVQTNKDKFESVDSDISDLSLQDIANTVQLNSPKEAEMHVLQMILEDPEQYKTCEMIERIDLSIQRIMMLSKKLTTMNEIMSCDPSYLGKSGKERQRFDFDDFDTVPAKFSI
ncbi:hypothetical protein Pfo_030291 [Paulownia fortunei]|nr:hypothetical protein Pfo_030291 [Paulownia fortunei]